MKAVVSLAVGVALLVVVPVASQHKEDRGSKFPLTIPEMRLVGQWQPTVASASEGHEELALDDSFKSERLIFYADGTAVHKLFHGGERHHEWYLAPDAVVLVDGQSIERWHLLASTRHYLVFDGWGDGFREGEKVYWRRLDQTD